MLVNNEVNLHEQNFGTTLQRQEQDYSEYPVRAIQNPFMIKFDAVKSSVDGKNLVLNFNLNKTCSRNHKYFWLEFSKKDGLYLSIINNNPTRPFKMLISWSVEIERFFDEVENSIFETFYLDSSSHAKFLSNYSMEVEHKTYLEKWFEF